MASRLRWGLLSTARINRSLIPRMHDLPRHDLVAVASRDVDRARSYATEWNIPRAHGSYEALLADPEIDAVYIPLPNGLHAAWTIAAARAGKHVLCEKPMGLSLVEFDAMTDAAREAGVVLAEAFMYRHHPQTTRVKALVDEGAVGDVRLIRGAFAFWLSRDADVRLDPAQGGGSLWDVGCYPVSYARFVLGGEPVEAFGMQQLGPTGIDLAFAGQLRFARDRMAQFDSGFRSHFRAHIEVVGSDGVLSVPNPYKPAVREQVVLRHGDETRTIEIEGVPTYAGELDDMAGAVLDGRPPRISLAESRGNLVALLALAASARSGQAERIREQGIGNRG